MVAGQAGWTILSALGVLCAGRYAEDIDVIPLPVAPLSRRIALIARKDGVPDMAADIAGQLRPLLAREAVDPLVARLDWIAPLFKVLEK